MKKMHFVLVLAIVSVFLLGSCGLTERPDSEILSELSRGNDYDQGEDEGNGKKPPVVNPPEITPPEENDNDLDNTATFWRASWGGALQGLPFDRYKIPGKIVITDTAMLQEYFSDTYSLSLNEAGNGWVRDERFSDVIAKYDDSFFESRQLVTFYLTAGGGGMEFELNGTTYIDGILNINIDYVSIGMGIAALVEWFAIVETNKVPADTAVNVNVTDWIGRVYTF